MVGISFSPASAETIESALLRAYSANSTLNAQRANLRATDENVPRALSGFRPRVAGAADVGPSHISGSYAGLHVDDTFVSRGAGVQVDQNLYRGFRDWNSTRQAQSQVLGVRETLRSTEQAVLLDGATAYLNVLRDRAILNLNRNNVEVLEEQLRQTRGRFRLGEVTRTDVAQAESRLALGRSQVSAAEAALSASIAAFRRVIGIEPGQLAPGRPLDRLVPRTVDQAIRIGLGEHPTILSAVHALDAAELQVKITEGELKPTVDILGRISKRWENTASQERVINATAAAQVTVPIYEGGEVYARVRQSKELAGQRRIEADVARDQVRANVVTAWSQFEAAKAQITATQAQVQAAEVALMGVREEARVGRRTILDILNAQQELLSARVNLLMSQRDRVVASYNLLSTIGRLTIAALGIRHDPYNANQHLDQVKDLWYGRRTPDGR